MLSLRRPRLYCAALSVALCVATLVAAPAPATVHQQAPIYLALGDSVAAGVGATSPARGGYVPVLRDLLNRARGCPPKWAQTCRLELVNVAVPGATTTSLVAEQLPRAAALAEKRNSDRTRVNDVRVITVDIGGNDVFGPVVAACSDPTSPGCGSTIRAVLRRAAANYDVMLSTLRAAAGRRSVIAVMTYYNPLPSCRLAELAPLARRVLEGGAPVRAGLNDIIRAKAARYGAVVAETARVIGADDLVGGTDCLHPDDSGHADIAASFARAIDDQLRGRRCAWSAARR